MANYSPTPTDADLYARRLARRDGLDGTVSPYDPQPVTAAPPMSTNTPPLAVTPTMSSPLPPATIWPTTPVMTTGGNLPPLEQVVNTGGNQPPVAVPVMNTGGNLPPLTQTVSTGGNLPPLAAPNGNTGIVPPYMQTGGNLPPLAQLALSLPALNGQQYVATQQNGTGPAMGADQIVQNTLANLLDRNNPYIARARQAAMDAAGERGMVNSSIAAGNAEGAAIDAALPFVQQSLGIQQQRENNAFTGLQSELNRTQGVNNAMLNAELTQRQTAYDYQFKRQIQEDSVRQQDWLNNNEFSRNFNATLSMLPVNNAIDMSKAIQLYAAQDPETYTPQVVSGITNFFNQNMLAIMQQYFPQMFGGS